MKARATVYISTRSKGDHFEQLGAGDASRLIQTDDPAAGL